MCPTFAPGLRRSRQFYAAPDGTVANIVTSLAWSQRTLAQRGTRIERLIRENWTQRKDCNNGACRVDFYKREKAYWINRKKASHNRRVARVSLIEGRDDDAVIAMFVLMENAKVSLVRHKQASECF